MRKYLHILIALLFCLFHHGIAQSFRQPVSSIYPGLGAYSTKQQDVFSFINNQAALVQTKQAAAGVYGERRFLLAATSLYTVAVAMPTSMGNFGVSLKYGGFKNFNESQAGLAYARRLGSKIDLGIQFNYYGYRVQGYSSANTVNFEIGAIAHLTDQLNIGLHVYNPVGGKFSKTDEELTTAYTIGLGYDASDRFFVSAEVVRQEDYPVNAKAGLQYQFMKQFFARVGISSGSSAAYGGVGIGWNNLRLDFSGSYHPQLGWSPGLLLIVNFGKQTSPVPEEFNPAAKRGDAFNPLTTTFKR